ncbi:MAG: zinc-dependent metalloprotease [Rothia sp. (in: high G+C Gram-positive bacteria)]|uniref:zinc-dependent metalloprotease n=1 Tax=Rothia sp. (in: high G+C Gram-positive bacteria) TaxID=1885016 RepID=UPI0026DFDC2D|nr:zinc-dependent metalloprotease [Rothia sp. (in: high G+C Gram-positive bacteria)]MDO5751050.1 zinc-dependent metalloprotease [Rothia sp. (in: high G+C Gram-positive bacteria)]
MAENSNNNPQNDPLEEFLKKLREQGFDPAAENAADAQAAANNPFSGMFSLPLDGNIDPEELKNMGLPFDPSMLQGMFSQMQAMFSGQGGAAEKGVNWSQVKEQTRQLISRGSDPSVPTNLEYAAVDAANLADLWLDTATVFERHNIPLEAWGKTEWLDASFSSWRTMIEPVAAEVTESMVMPMPGDVPPEMAQILNNGVLNNIGATIFGAQTAQALAGLADEVYTSTDIGFPLAPGRTALLPNGYAQLSEEIEVPAQEILLYLAVREAALVRLHRHTPWLLEDINALVARYARGIRVDMNRIQDSMSTLDVHSPEEMQEALEGGMLNPQRTEDQELAVARLETLLALIEGWVSLVTEQATRNLPGSAKMAEMMTRRRIEGGPAEQVFANLVGLEMRPRLVREAQEFWRNFEENHGYEARDGLWAAPETLPTADELETPGAYAARVASQQVSDDDFDSELQKLLDGGFES